MKALSTLLVCSLAANAALVGVCLSRPDWVASTVASLHLGSKPEAPALAPKPVAAVKPGSPAGIWGQIDDSDIAGAVARLKAAGFPDRFARAIGMALLSDKYRHKRNALVADAKPLPYWKSQGWRTLSNDYTPKLNQLGRDQMNEATALGLLEGTDSDILSDIRKKHQYGDLPQETISKIEKIQSDYSDMQQQLYGDHPGAWTKDMATKQAYLDKQKQADLAQTLTPDELETYQLHSSPVAQRVQANLQYFDATEAEYKAIFDAQQPVLLPTTMPRTTGFTADEMAQQKAMQTAADQQVEAALGPDRFAEYQKDTSPIYTQTAQALTPLNVPQATVDQVYSTAKTSQDQINAIRSDPTLSGPDKNSQITAVVTQAASALSSVLGDQNFQAYKEQVGYWLNPPRPPPPGLKVINGSH